MCGFAITTGSIATQSVVSAMLKYSAAIGTSMTAIDMYAIAIESAGSAIRIDAIAMQTDLTAIEKDESANGSEGFAIGIDEGAIGLFPISIYYFNISICFNMGGMVVDLRLIVFFNY